MIRVIIERTLKEGCEKSYLHAIRKLKQQACHKQGYISGEVLGHIEDPLRCLVLSNWQDIDSWKVWENSEERKAQMEIINEMLSEEEKVSVYQPATLKS